MRERSEAQEEMRRESGQLSVRQIPSTFMFLCYTSALQHSLQDLRLCKLYHILFAFSEETLRGIISNKMSLRSSCISSVLHFFFFSNSVYYFSDINYCWCCCPSAAL